MFSETLVGRENYPLRIDEGQGDDWMGRWLWRSPRTCTRPPMIFRSLSCFLSFFLVSSHGLRHFDDPVLHGGHHFLIRCARSKIELYAQSVEPREIAMFSSGRTWACVA